MIVAGSLELTHARVLARHGERLAAADWRRIEAIRDWAPALELARTTALRPWLEGVSVDSGVAQIEDVEAAIEVCHGMILPILGRCCPPL